MSCLRIQDLHVDVDGKEILKGLSLDIHSGEIQALMGRTGMENPPCWRPMEIRNFIVSSGSILLDGQMCYDGCG